jgi:8-oxo-dGTP pyrophosphatase MutT (NUDIX family)
MKIFLWEEEASIQGGVELSQEQFQLGYDIEKLSRALKSVSGKKNAEAAVALLLKEVDENFQILFVERVKNPVDPWSGQMAFPGGKRSSTDRNLMQTIVRETLEETSIDLLDQCRFLGAMTALTSTQKPEMKVLPFVFLLQHEQPIKLNRGELESFVWISLEELFQNEGRVKFEFGEYPAYVVTSNVIWGLTYRVLKNLKSLLCKEM